jgi:predicted transcriptional regulator of viral defense system
VSTLPQATGLPTELAQAPLRTVRARDVTVYSYPRTQLARLEHRGVLHRLADGFYVAVPQDRVSEPWLPTLEGAAAGIAAAEFGDRQYALMGVSAARLHRVLPRAFAVAYVAAPRRRQELRLTDRDARIRFLPRDLDLIHVELLRTDLGECLVTTPEQTVLDLAHLRRNPAEEDDVRAAIRALLARCDDANLEEIAATQRRGRALTLVRHVARAA